MKQTAPVSRTIVILASALALALAAFAHRPVAFAHGDAGAAVAWVLPDGSRPVLCLADAADGGHDPSDRRCDFCAIAKSGLAADAAPVLPERHVFRTVELPAPGGAEHGNPAVRPKLPRGPPSA